MSSSCGKWTAKNAKLLTWSCLPFVLYLNDALNSLSLVPVTLGTLQNHDGDGNRNVKKPIGLMSKTTTLHVHHAFLYSSLLSLHNYDVKWPNFNFTWERERKAINSTISVWTRVRSLLFSSIPNSLLLSSWVHEDNREKKWKDAKSIFSKDFVDVAVVGWYKVPIIKHKPHFSPPLNIYLQILQTDLHTFS